MVEPRIEPRALILLLIALVLSLFLGESSADADGLDALHVKIAMVGAGSGTPLTPVRPPRPHESSHLSKQVPPPSLALH